MELEPTKENLIKTYLEDSIGRNEDIKGFARFLNTIDGAYSIALNGDWGSGKTFFIKQTKMFLDAQNERNNQELSVFKDESEYYQPQLTIYFDAWKYDDCNPLLAILNEIVEEVGFQYELKEKKSFIECTKKIVNCCSSIVPGMNGISKVLELLDSGDPLEVIKTRNIFKENIENFVNAALNETGNRLTLIIDELDRCNPKFAVDLLEKIKHYFVMDNVTCVFSINMRELQHTIRRYYGDGYDGNRYLDRFFNIRMRIPELDQAMLYNYIRFNHYNYLYDQVGAKVVDYFNFSMRESIHYVEKLKKIYNRSGNVVVQDIMDNYDGWNLCYCCLLPIMVGLDMIDSKKYEDFIEGRDGEVFSTIISEINSYITLEMFFNEESDESMGSNNELYENKDMYQVVYETVFRRDMTNSGVVKIKNLTFHSEFRKHLIDIVGANMKKLIIG